MYGATSSIVWPPIMANNFELKQNFIPLFLEICQFDGFQDEDPYAHLTNFLEIGDIY